MQQQAERHAEMLDADDVQACEAIVDDDESVQMLQELVRLLGAKRAEKEETWIQVGWALYNTPTGSSATRLELWKNFARLCPAKFDEAHHNKKWHSMTSRPNGFKMPSLCQWAKEDNPEGFRDWIKKASRINNRQAAGIICAHAQKHPQIKTDALVMELQNVFDVKMVPEVDFREDSITLKSNDGSDCIIKRDKYIAECRAKHASLPANVPVPPGTFLFLKNINPKASFNAKFIMNGKQITGMVAGGVAPYDQLKVEVHNMHTDRAFLNIVALDGTTKICKSARDVKSVIMALYKAQEEAMHNRFGITQNIFINTGTISINTSKGDTDEANCVVMLNAMMEYAKEHRLMKANNTVYEPVPGSPCAYRELCDYKQFVNRSLKSNRKHAGLIRKHPRHVDDCIKYLNNLIEEEDMPDYIVDKDLLSFRNGVLRLSTIEFVPYGSNFEILHGKVARNHIDCDYEASSDTPNIDKVLDTQFEDEDVKRIFFALVGRLFFEVGQFDKWQVMPFLVGVGGTGKSLLLNVISKCFSESALGNISGKREEVFGLANLHNKEVVMGCDMPVEMSKCLPQVLFQNMTAGDRVEVPRKSTTALHVQWKAPIIMASNYMPDYVNSGNNIGRRIVSFRFTKSVATRDYGLQDAILHSNELANFVYRSLTEYRALRERITGDFWMFVPRIMIEWQSKVAAATNKLSEFLSMEDSERGFSIVCEEGAVTPMAEFKRLFKRVMETDFVNDVSVFRSFGFECPEGQVNLCKGCGKIALKGCCSAYSITNRTRCMVLLHMVTRAISENSC